MPCGSMVRVGVDSTKAPPMKGYDDFMSRVHLRSAVAKFLTALVVILISMAIVTILYMGSAWYQRELALEGQAGVILDRANDLVRETRVAIVQVSRLTTEPCSADDLAAMRLIAINLFFLMDIARGHDGHVQCDIAGGTEPPIRDLGPPSFSSRLGLKVWIDAAVFPDRRLRAIVAEGGGVMTFSRPVMFTDKFKALGDANAAITSIDGNRLFAWSDNPAAPPAPFTDGGVWRGSPLEHRLRVCDQDGNLCVHLHGAALTGLWPIPLPVLLVLMLVGLVVGLMVYGLGAAWLASRRTLLNRLRRAIRNDDMVVVYQPLVCMSDRRLVGMEALARWQLRSGEMVSPDIFIPMAERQGLIKDLTANIITRVLSEMAGVLMSNESLYVCINISLEDLLSPTLAEHLDAECLLHGVGRSQVALEITERATDEVDRISEAVHRLRDRGFRVCLDDFGTGYSSLGYLATLPIDKIKLDKLFTRSVGTSLVGTIVLSQICAMVKTLELRIVFEGVETEEQAAALCELAPGAIGQGWLYGRPMPAADIARIAFRAEAATAA